MGPLLFAWLVRNEGLWDIKGRYGAEYEDFGNFFYGAAGTAAGFTEEALLRMGGVVQIVNQWLREAPPGAGWPWDQPITSCYGDQPSDYYMIAQGIAYYKSLYGSPPIWFHPVVI